jgi:DNA repair protein RadC
MEEESFQSQRYRKFLKQRFIEGGLDGFVDDEVLELLLVYAMARRDIRPLAKSLLRTFGDFKGVLDAPIKELVAFPGMDVHAAVLIKAARDFPEFYAKVISKPCGEEEAGEHALCLVTKEGL